MSNTGGEAAEQIVRMSLEGSEVAVRLAGEGARQLAVLLYAVLRDQKKTRGKARLSGMLRSGKELKVFAVKDEELKRFCTEARKYGVLYCVLKDRDAADGITDIMVRAEDASKINRIFERFKLATVDLASVRSEIERSREEKGAAKDAVPIPEHSAPKTAEQETEAFLDAVFGTQPAPDAEERGQLQKAGSGELQRAKGKAVNPTPGRTAGSRPSEPTSKPKGLSARDISDVPEARPSVRRMLNEIREQLKQSAADKGRAKDTPQKPAQHKAPPRKRGSKEKVR